MDLSKPEGRVEILPRVDGAHPLILAYCSDVYLQVGGGTLAIWHISITAYVVIVLFRFFEATRDCAVGVVCLDYRMGGNVCSVHVPMSTVVRH